MSKDNILKKQWQKSDVKRARNLVLGRSGNRTNAGVGYSQKQEVYSEGDIWEENSKTWTIKDGIKQNITKLDKAKKSVLVPLFCPTCKKIMKGKNDKDFYHIHMMCNNCVIDMETTHKAEGTWEAYKNNLHNKEIDKVIEEYKAWWEDQMYQSNDSFVTEDGIIEKWDGHVNQALAEEGLEKTLEYLYSLKRE